jgi:hypothetical protein
VVCPVARYCPHRCSHLELDTRLLQITHSYLNPPQSPSHSQEEAGQDEITTPSVALDSEPSTDDVGVAGLPGAVTTTGSFRFMQASELEAENFEDNVQFIEHSDADLATSGEAPGPARTEVCRAYNSSEPKLIHDLRHPRLPVRILWTGLMMRVAFHLSTG